MAVALVDAAGLVKVNVFLVAGLGTTVVTLVIGEALAGTVLGVGEAGALAVSVAFVAASAAGAFVSRAEGVVVGAGEFAAFGGAASHVAKPLVGGRIPVAVEVDRLVGETKIEVLGVDHAAAKRIVGGATEVGNVNGIGEVEVLGATVGVGGDKIDVGVRLYDPDKLFDGVVEVELDLVGSRVDGLRTSELELLNEVFVGNLGETTTLIRCRGRCNRHRARPNEGKEPGWRSWSRWSTSSIGEHR